MSFAWRTFEGMLNGLLLFFTKLNLKSKKNAFSFQDKINDLAWLLQVKQ